MRLIDADTLMKQYEETLFNKVQNGFIFVPADFTDLIDNAPTIDAVSEDTQTEERARFVAKETELAHIEARLENAEKRLQWTCTANFVAEQLNKLEDMTVSEKLKLIQDLLGVEFREENLNYEHATLVDIKEPLKVAVVRCKDCTQKHIGGSVTHYYWCDRWDREVDDTDYCACGERREP